MSDLNGEEVGDTMSDITSVGDSPGEKLNSQIGNLIVYILKVLRSISTGNPAKVSHFIFPPTSFYISLQQFCGKGRTYNTSFSRKLLFFQKLFTMVLHNFRSFLIMS